MPAPGDQYRDTPATVNPFADKQPHITGYTAQEIATLQSRLDKQLGPEYISTRPGNGGGKVHYLAAEKVINLANEVFGFNGWSSAIQNVQIDFVDENATTGRISLGLSTIVRVTLRDGTYHEDIGYGHCENTKGKAAAFEKAKKEAATDAMKRALRNFGNVLGNCLYDKDYLQKITKVKVAPSRWDADNLHRHPDYAPIKREAVAETVQATSVARNVSIQSNASLGSEMEDEFGGNIFDETDYTNPDEVRLDESRMSDRPAAPTVNRPGPIPNRQSAPNAQQPRPNTNPQPQPQPQPRPNNPRVQPHTPGPPANADVQKMNQSSNPSVESPLKPPEVPQTAPPPGMPDGFVAAKQADAYNQPNAPRPPNTAMVFNPHAESPSIRRTQGVNPGKSVPISRHQIQNTGSKPQTPNIVPPTINHPPAGINIINPAADTMRRVGMPSGPPLNRGGYRAPTALKRPAMADVTNLQQVDGAGDAKKLKTAEPAETMNQEQEVVT